MIRSNRSDIAVYHFTTGRNEEQIKDDGLQPRSNMVCATLADYLTDGSSRMLPEEAYQGVWYGILPDDLELWKNSPQQSSVWDSMMEHILSKERLRSGNVFKMQAMADPDTLAVFDFIHLARAMSNNGYERKARVIDEAIKAYWDSGTPLKRYAGGYSLPETVSWSPVGRENLFTKSKVTYTSGPRQFQPLQN